MRSRLAAVAAAVAALVVPLSTAGPAAAADDPAIVLDAPASAVNGDVVLNGRFSLDGLGAARPQYLTVSSTVADLTYQAADTTTRRRTVSLHYCPEAGACAFSFPLSTEEMANGLNRVSINLFDSTSRVFFGGADVEVSNAKPTVAITSPAADEQSWAEPVTVSVAPAATADPAPVVAVKYYRHSGGLLGTATAAPWSLPHSAMTEVGRVAVDAVAVDAAGNVSTPSSVRFLRTPGPLVSISHPAPSVLWPRTNSTILGWHVREPDGLDLFQGRNHLTNIAVLLDGTVVQDYPDTVCAWKCGPAVVTESHFNAVLDTRAWTVGEHVVTVRAEDTTGAVGEASIPVRILSEGGNSNSPVVILGGPTRTTTYGATVTVAGAAPPTWNVGVLFRQAGGAAYVQRRSLTASPTGTWSTTYVADKDYRLYATTGTGTVVGQTSPILVQVAPSIDGRSARTVPRGSTHTVTGTGVPGTTLTLHFHRAGTPATDYSIKRTVVIGSNGRWSRSYVASVDYRFYASLPNGQVSPTVLVQAR